MKIFTDEIIKEIMGKHFSKYFSVGEGRKLILTHIESLNDFEYGDGYSPKRTKRFENAFGGYDTRKNGQYFIWCNVGVDLWNNFIEYCETDLKDEYN